MEDQKPAPTVIQTGMGWQLAAVRTAVALTAAQAAKRLRAAATTITRIEKAETALRFANVKELLENYEVSQEETQEFLALLDKASNPGWWQSFRHALPNWFDVYVPLEDAATQVRGYDPQVVPGKFPDIACSDSLNRVHYTQDAQETALYHEALDQMTAYVLSAFHQRRPQGGIPMSNTYALQAATELGREHWQNLRSGSNKGRCVEAKELVDGRVALCQSQDPDGSALICTRDEMEAFVIGAKTGQADFLLA